MVQPEDVNAEAARAQIAAAEPEAVCICAFGALIKEPLLSDHDWFNVHPSLLPRWRGAAPIERAIEAGDAETGVSIMRPTAELDAGPVHRAQAVPIAAGDDYGSLAAAPRGARRRPARRGARTTGPNRCPSRTEGVTYAEKIESGRAAARSRAAGGGAGARVRALTPHIGAHVELAGRGAAAAARGAPGGAAGPGRASSRVDGRSGCSSAPPTARSSCGACSPRAASAMGAADWVRGRGAAVVA